MQAKLCIISISNELVKVKNEVKQAFTGVTKNHKLTIHGVLLKLQHSLQNKILKGKIV